MFAFELAVRTIYDMPLERADPLAFFRIKKATVNYLVYPVSNVSNVSNVCIRVEIVCLFIRFILRCYNWYFGDPSNIVVYCILFIYTYVCCMLYMQHNIFSKFLTIFDLYFNAIFAVWPFGSIFNASNTYFATFDVDACERTDDITIYVTFVHGTWYVCMQMEKWLKGSTANGE